MAASPPHSVIELLQWMVGINTINAALPGAAAVADGEEERRGGEAELAAGLAAFASSWGLATQRLPVPGQADQLLITLEVDAELPWLLFDSHLDTVAVEGMTIDPFASELSAGKVWGRGSCDTKGTGAAMLWAMKECAAASGRDSLPKNLALLFSVDEEISMTGINAFVRDVLPTMGWDLFGAVVGEPTELRPVVAHNGCARFRLATRGVACHSSLPHEGRSAISAMARVIQHLETVHAPSLTASHDLTGYATCTLNTIRGGSAPNIIPDRCVIEIDRRSVPGERWEADVVGRLESSLADLAEADGALDYELRVDSNHPPLTTDRNDGLTRWVQNVLKQQSLPTLCLGAPFCTHAGMLDSAGLPAIVIGPGSPHKAHTKDEWVAVEQIERGVTLYRQLMEAALPPANS